LIRDADYATLSIGNNCDHLAIGVDKFEMIGENDYLV